MNACSRLQQWTAGVVIAASITIAVGGCATVPRRYTLIAERGITLTTLSTNPQSHVGKVVILGGTITEEEENEQYLYLCLKNRPLDQDYKPHRPPDSVGPEAGSYWVMVSKQQ